MKYINVIAIRTINTYISAPAMHVSIRPHEEMEWKGKERKGRNIIVS